MKLPLGITLALALLVISQNLQQVSSQVSIPDEWKRSNETVYEDENGEHSLDTAAEPTGGNEEVFISNEDTQATPLSSESNSENEGQSDGSLSYSGNEQQEQNFTSMEQIPPAADVLPGNDTEEGSSDGPVATTPPLMVALNSSSDLSDTSTEYNETQIPDTESNTSTSEPVHTNQTVLNNTYPDSNPENTTADSSYEETGSGSLPSEEVATKSPTTMAEDHLDQENIPNKSTVKPPEPSEYTTTKAMTPPAIPEDVSTAAPDNENAESNLTGSFDTRGNSAKEFSSEVQEKKNGQAWAVILVIGIIVGIVALTAFIVLNRRNHRDFSHRKLVDETSPDPVHRLDNSDPLDLKLDGFGYNNPGVQMDNIQMTNFPQGRLN